MDHRAAGRDTRPNADLPPAPGCAVKARPERIGIAIAVVPGLALALIIGLFSPRPWIDGIADVAEAIGQEAGFAANDDGSDPVGAGTPGDPTPGASPAGEQPPVEGSTAPPGIGGISAPGIPGVDPAASGDTDGNDPDVAGEPGTPSQPPGGGAAPGPAATGAPTPAPTAVAPNPTRTPGAAPTAAPTQQPAPPSTPTPTAPPTAAPTPPPPPPPTPPPPPPPPPTPEPTPDPTPVPTDDPLLCDLLPLLCP